VFQAGMNWRVVDAKWPGITAAFHRFKTERVARMSDKEVDAVAKDEAVIRSRPKIAAVRPNAHPPLQLQPAGRVQERLRSYSDYEELATDLKKRFKFVGDSGVYHFLWTVKHPVPEWHAWAKSHGMIEGGRAKGTARPRTVRKTATKTARKK